MARLHRCAANIIERRSTLRQHIRTFVDYKVKLVHDPYLDNAVQKELDLKSVLSFKDLILSKPSKTLPLATASLQEPNLNLPTTASQFVQKYPFVFHISQPKNPLYLPRVKLSTFTLSLHKVESKIFNSIACRKDAAERLEKFLMLAKAKRLPLYVIDKFKYDLGLPRNYILSLLTDFRNSFELCDLGFRDSNGSEVFGLGLVSWKDHIASSVLESRERDVNSGLKEGMPITFPMNFPRGFALVKKVKIWVDEWQKLPYISPYEDAFQLAPNSDQAEKWTVAVLHELLHLMVSKKTERENLLCLGDYLGFGTRFETALSHHPGIFYVCNKIRTQTVVLREAYIKDVLVERHPLMDMRDRYIQLMNKVVRRNSVRARADELKSTFQSEGANKSNGVLGGKCTSAGK